MRRLKLVKKSALQEFHKTAINLFSDKIKEIEIFGLTARGEDLSDSYIDIFMLVKEKR